MYICHFVVISRIFCAIYSLLLISLNVPIVGLLFLLTRNFVLFMCYRLETMLVGLILSIYCLILHTTSAQKPSDTLTVSLRCKDDEGSPQMCYPPFSSVIAERKVQSTNTCGENNRQKYCIHMSASGMASRCQYCDARNPHENHPPEHMTDKNPYNWWQSETMADNASLHFRDSVNLTVDFGTQFHVNYVYMRFKSPRPHAMVIYKKFNSTSDWTSWAYFSSNCHTYFDKPSYRSHNDLRGNEAVCTQEYSTLQPLEDGEVIFSVINHRPNYNRFFEDEALQQWSTASEIRVELKSMHTFGDERGAERDTLLTYYFAIKEFTVGGRCLCHGHGNECRESSGPGKKFQLVCVCDPSHRTAGDNCEQCAPDSQDVPWQPATPSNPNPCKPCKCNGNSQRCDFDQALYEATGSGSRCIGCGNNTEGVNCDKCKVGFYPDPNYPSICRPCACDPVGSLEDESSSSSSQCAPDGQCKCKPGVGGLRCDQCLADYFGFGSSGCQSCNCNVGGSFENRAHCDPNTGQCLCKQNVAGRQCDKCQLGHYGLMSNDPLGCKPCSCSLHSSECQLDNQLLAESVGKPGLEVELASLVDPDQVVFTCPEGLLPCYACLYQDKHVRVDCNGTREGVLPCLCTQDQNDCPFCPSGFRKPQSDPRKEICTCPPQYIGDSCETCAPGHRRDPPSGLTTDRCIACTCNNHSTVCHPETGQCECSRNTGGLFCDRCADGYYGNAKAPVDSPEACKKCPCPDGANCEEVHWPDSTMIVCKDCPDNRAGIRCKECAQNFYGDPEKGIPCKPCDCSGNVDPREFGNCDSKTGECLKCLFGTIGKRCEQCLPGFRRNFKTLSSNSSSTNTSSTELARGCSPCYCDRVGTMPAYSPDGIGVCEAETGQCPCKSGVGGLRCEACFPGFYGFNSNQGCRPCDCNSVGAVGESCDNESGQCKCRPYVIGRQCDQCQATYYQLNADTGCKECQCDPHGSNSSQCNSKGQCLCRPFAVGDKCDSCQENHYDLSSGCLPCPACYKLVQARVNKLWAILESVFGPIRSSSDSVDLVLPPTPSRIRDDDELEAELLRINATVVQLYNQVLEQRNKPSTFDVDQINSTITSLVKQIADIKAQAKNITETKSACQNNVLQEALRKEIDENLPKALEKDVQGLLDDLKAKSASVKSDPILTKRAEELYAIRERLFGQGDEMKRQSDNITSLLADSTVDLNKLELKIEESVESGAKIQRQIDLMSTAKKELSKKLETAGELVQKTDTDLYNTQTRLDKLPNVEKDIAKLESVVKKWAEANETSHQLTQRLANLTQSIESQLDQLRQTTSRLRSGLNQGHDRVNAIKPTFDQLNQLVDRVERARNSSWLAYERATDNLAKLEDFDAYVAKTKARLTDALASEAGLSARLTDVESSLSSLHAQANTELGKAKKLNKTVAEMQAGLASLRDQLDLQEVTIAGLTSQLTDLSSRLDVDVTPSVDQAREARERVSAAASNLFTTVDESQRGVEKLGKEAANLLERMRKLGDQLSGTGSGSTVNPSDDANARFKELQDAIDELNLVNRLSILKQFQLARSTELASIKRDSLELKAHYEHLTKVNDLLPTSEAGSFYTGKGIEGDTRSRTTV